MKYKLKRIVFVMVGLMAYMAGRAEGVVTPPGEGTYLHIGGIAYKVTSSSPRTVTVTNKYDTNTQVGVQKTYTGNVVIPDTIIYSDVFGSWKYAVTSIDNNAFQYGSGMTALTIPKTVASISSTAFTNATGLSSLTIEDGSSSIAISLPNSPLTNLYIGRNVTTYGAFKGATNLMLTLGGQVNEVNDGIFQGANNLNSIVFPEHVTRIGHQAFKDCTSLKYISMPKTIHMIYYYAFENCSSLEKMFIPKSVNTVAPYSFQGCTSLKTFIIEDGENELTMGAADSEQSPFANCPIDSLYLGRNIQKKFNGFWGQDLTKVTIGDGVTKIVAGMFSGCSKLTDVQFGKNISSIGENMFYGCSSLETIDLTSKLNQISYKSFSGCTNLKEVILPSNLGMIYYNAFEYCSSLEKIIIPKSVNLVAPYSFQNCTSLKTFIIEDGENELIMGLADSEQSPFANCPIDSLYLGRNIQKKFNRFFGQELTKVTLGKNVTNVLDNIFSVSKKIACVYPLWEQPISITRNVFPADVYTNATLFVPNGTIPNYQATAAWNEFANIVETKTTPDTPSIKKGDLNGDGVVSITDVVMIIDVIAGTITDANQVAAADVNGDGSVTITDCVAAIDLIAQQ